MPLCSRCNKLKLATGFYTYRIGSGRVQRKNPCIECTKRNTRVSKTRCKGLTVRRG
jgi:hypothetical protein